MQWRVINKALIPACNAGSRCSAKPLPNILRPGINSLVADQFDAQDDHYTSKPFNRQAFRKYLEYGSLAHGFAKA